MCNRVGLYVGLKGRCALTGYLTIVHSVVIVAVIKKPWSKTEEDAISLHLGRHLARQETPNQKDCEECIQKAAPALDQRTWASVKFKCRNMITSRKNKSSS